MNGSFDVDDFEYSPELIERAKKAVQKLKERGDRRMTKEEIQKLAVALASFTD